MVADAASAKDIRELVMQQWEKAGENYENSESIIDNAQKSFSLNVDKYLKEYDEHQKENWKTSKRIVVYDNEEQFRKFLVEAKENGENHKKLYFGRVSDITAQKIREKYGYDIYNYNCTLRADEVRKILKKHGKKEEMLSGQVPITLEHFEKIPEIVGNPDSIEFGGFYENKPVFNMKKDGQTVTMVAQKDNLDFFTQTMFKSQKNRSLATTPGDMSGDIFPQTSKTLSSTASKTIIPRNQKNDTKNSLNVDSTGRELTSEQKNFFKDSKVVDSDGRLQVMYHGTPNAGFTEFREGSYFTSDKEYAERYKVQSTKRTANNPDMYSVYLNTTNPFDVSCSSRLSLGMI